MKKGILALVFLGVSLSTGCVGGEYQTEYQVYKKQNVSDEARLLGDIVLSLYPEEKRESNIPIISPEQSKGVFTANLLGIDTVVHDAYAIKLGTDFRTEKGRETIVVVKEEQGFEWDVVNGMTQYYIDMAKQIGEEEAEKIKDDVIVTTAEGYNILIISKHAELVYREILRGIEDGSADRVKTVLAD